MHRLTAVAANLGLFDDDRCQRSREFLMELTRMIGALIISLQRGSGRHRDDYDSEPTNGDPVDVLDAIDTDF